MTTEKAAKKAPMISPLSIRRGIPDLDPSFLSSTRARLLQASEGGAVPIEPYSTHEWVNAAIGRIATNIAAVPFAAAYEIAESGLDPKITKRVKTRAVGMWKSQRPRPFIIRQHPRRASILRAPLKRRLNFRVDRDLAVLKGSDWVELLHQPNPNQSGTELLKLTIIDYLQNGMVYWVCTNGYLGDDPTKRLKPNEMPTEIRRVRYSQLRPVYENDELIAWVWNRVQRGKSKTGDLVYLLPHEVVEFKTPNPIDDEYGLPMHSPLYDVLVQDVRAKAYNRAFFNNEGVPGNVYLRTEEGLTEDQVEQLQEQWDEYTGPGRGAPFIAHSGIQASTLGISQRDMEFPELMRMNRTAILAHLGVPEAELSIFENLVESNATVQDRVFWTKTLIPIMLSIEITMNMKLIAPRSNELIFFDLTAVPALTRVLDGQLNAAERLVRLGYPINMVNDRLDLGFPELEWGDESLVPGGNLPVDEVLNPLALPGDEDPLTPRSVGPSGRIFSDTLTQEEVDEIDRTAFPETKEGGDLVSTEPQPFNVKKRLTAARREQMRLRVIRNVHDKVEKPFMGKYRRWLNEFRGAQLEALNPLGKSASAIRDLISTKNVDRELLERVLVSRDDFARRLLELVRPEFNNAAELSLDMVGEELGGVFQFDLGDPRLLEFMASKEIKLAGVTDTVIQAVRSAIFNGLDNGESVGQIQARLRQIFNLAGSRGRALRVARTETAITQSTVRNLSFEAEGVEQHEWADAKDEVTRTDHKILGRLGPVPVGTNFMRFLSKPGTLMYASDVNGPIGQIANCRCVMFAAF